MRRRHAFVFGSLLLLLPWAAVQFGELSSWLVARDEPTQADAILVLDGGEIRERLAIGLDLLRRGYAPRLIVSQSVYGSSGEETRQMASRLRNESVLWLHNAAASTREEAREARATLRRLGCRRLLLVTSAYHTRRARAIFRQELVSDGIEIRVVPVFWHGVEGAEWWWTREGRATIICEFIKLGAVAVHFEPPLLPETRCRLKTWVWNLIP